MSRREYKKFGLKQTQDGQLMRALQSLCRHQYIQQIDTKAGIKKINVYRFCTYEVIAPFLISQTADSEKTDSKRTPNRHETDSR